MNDLAGALDVCFEIVGQRPEKGLLMDLPDPLHRDECAVWTMEDIAKICQHCGRQGQAVAWLKQAGSSGVAVWGETAQLGHIRDKLAGLVEGTK